MIYKDIITDIYSQVKATSNKGETAKYIPELAKIDENKFGIHITTVEGDTFGLGDFNELFSIQSIAKVLSLSMAYRIHSEKIWERVRVEPSGTAFNSLVQLESNNGIPRNPFLNGGALVICDILISSLKNPKKELIEYVRMVAEDDTIDYSDKVASSEKSVGFRNIAVCNFIKSFENIDNDPNEVLDLYFNLCSIEMSCRTMSKAFLFLANDGYTLDSKNKILNRSQTKRVNSIMQTCGLYDESGEFTFKVGLPGKSGVGGGIIAIHPGKYSISVWSPKLNPKGNSYRGVDFLEKFTSKTESSIF